ncbi:MAG: filamentous hemagglutinin N-terminal domain-containing protein [Candidatus Methylacidiphilales bacterium]|nr:filamentous hemagglutinin N-terminal domain-containing protein [Candidatus Methylacidiphilales bacterium]
MKYRRKIVFHAPPRILSAVVWLACFPGLSGVRANPVGEVIQSGTATFERTPDRLTVTTGDRVVIGWQDFSIGRGELTQFVQPSSSSLAVNRVMSGNPSQLFGTLQANGHVVLINPNGILVGGGAVVDTGSFLATTLDADPERLVTGQDWRFKGTSAAAIENQGTILARSGDLILISREVRNTGTLSAPSGVAALAGGREVLVSWAPDASRRIFVRPEGLDGRVHNAGAIAAAQAELVASGGNPYALAINNEGIIRATGSLKQEGRVYLVARDGTLGHSGSIYARNADGSGGSIRIEGSGVGVSGRLDTSSDLSKGGSIRIEGDHILLSHGAGLTVSGRTGGGSVEMGGGLHGDDPDIREAQNVTVENGVRIEADARQSGDGGLVVVWSNGATSFQGTISARGGVQGGNGGFVEVSGLESWFFPNWLTGVDVSAPAGKAGTFLIDPTEITITGNGTSVPIGNGTVSTATLLDQDVADYLQNVGNLVIQTTGANGDILILNGVSISWTSANDLTLSADRNLTFQSGAVISSATGDLNLNFAQSSDGTLTFADALPDVLALNISGGSGGGITTILRGPDNGAIFTISASTVNDGTQSATYSNIDQLVGGSGDDSFVFSGATTFSGDIDGGGATTGDTIDFSAATGFATTVDTGDLDPSNRAGTVIGVEVFVAPSGSQTLRGSSNASRSWNVGTNGVTTSGILYKGFENLLGRNGVDTFTFANGATFSGGIDGGSGSDVIVLTGSGQSISLTATGAGSVNGSGTFTDIQVLDGGGQGTLTGPNAATIWSITGSNSGTVLSTGFSNFGSLVGGNNVADSFVFDDAVVWAGSLNGGSGGANTLSFANFSTAVTANLAAGTSNKVTGGLSNIQTVIGGSGNDDLTGSSSFSSTLQGGGGDDTYRVTFGGAAITTTITEVALGGTDTVEVTGTSGADTFTMTAATTLSDGQHAVVFGGQVEDVNLDGLGAVDTLVGFNQANTFNVTGADAGDLGVIDFTSIESLTGGNVSDAFVFTALGSLGGDLQGGSGVDTYDFGGGGQVTGNINDTAGLSELYGTLAAGSITFGAVNLNSNTVLDTSSAGGSIGLGALTGSGYSLRISSGSGLKNLLGSVSGLSSSTGAALVLEGSGATDFASTVATNSGGIDASGSGGVTFHNGVTLGDGSVGTSFAGLVRFALSAATTFLGRDGLAFSGGVEVTGADLTINSQGSNVDLYGLDAGGRSVTIQAGAGTLDFLGQDAIQLQAFTVSAALTKLNSVTTTGTQSYTGPVRVSGTLDANRLEFYGSGAVTAANGTSAATTSAGQIHLDKSGGGPVVLANDGATTLTTGSTTSSLTLTVDNGDLTLGSGVQASTLIDLTVTAGGLFQTSGVLKAPTVSLTVSGATGTALAPIDTDTATQLDLDLGGNAFLVEQTLLDLGTAITYSGGVAVQTIDLTLSGGTARLAGNFGSVGDHFTLRVPTGSLQQVSGTFSADRLTVIASGGIGSTLSSLQTQAGSLDFTSGGSAGIYVSESNAVSFRADAGSGEVKVVTGGTLTIDGDITTTGDVVLRANSGNIQGSGVGSQTLSADDLQLLAPSGSILFNNLNLDINSGGTSSGGGIDLGDIVVTGDFTTTASGSVTQNGALEVGGVFTLNAANQSVVLNNAGNRFGSVAVRSDSLVLREADGMQLNQLEVNGSSSLISGGSITQTGALRTASLSLSASQGIVLENLLNRINVLGNVIRGAAFRLYNTVDLEINGEMSGGIAASGVQIVSEGDITLLSGTHILASGLGNDIVLASKSGNVADLSGASDSLETLSGSRFVIYSGTQVQTKTGLLTVNFIQLSSPYPSSPSGAGNAVLVREGLPGDTTIVVVVPYTPPVSPGAINVGDFGLRSIDIGNGGLGIGFRTGAGGSGGFGLFAVNDKGEAQEIGEDAAEALRELRRTLQEDMSASAKDDILQALADILSGRLDPREVRLPPGLLYQEDANGNSVIIKPELANQFLLSILDPKSYQQLAQALAALSKQP